MLVQSRFIVPAKLWVFTAKTLGLSVPSALLATADEMIE
jgi:hypothetical protein